MTHPCMTHPCRTHPVLRARFKWYSLAHSSSAVPSMGSPWIPPPLSLPSSLQRNPRNMLTLSRWNWSDGLDADVGTGWTRCRSGSRTSTAGSTATLAHAIVTTPRVGSATRPSRASAPAAPPRSPSPRARSTSPAGTSSMPPAWPARQLSFCALRPGRSGASQNRTLSIQRAVCCCRDCVADRKWGFLCSASCFLAVSGNCTCSGSGGLHPMPRSSRRSTPRCLRPPRSAPGPAGRPRRGGRDGGRDRQG